MRIVALFTACIMLVGCSLAPIIQSPTKQGSITLAISSDLVYMGSKAVDVLVSTINVASKGSLRVDLVVTDSPLDSLDSGAHLVLLSNEVAAMANADFEAYVSPYYFSDYNHFAMTLGSEDFNDITEEKNLSLLGAKPIGAMYGGSYVMVNGRPTPLTDPDGFKEGKITITPNPALAYILENLGMKVLQKDVNDIISGFNSESYSTIECPKAKLSELNMPSRSSKLLVSDSFHKVDINWIMISKNALNTLSDEEMAAITEGVAAAVAHNDHYVLEQEQRGIDHIESFVNNIEPASYSSFTEIAEDSLANSIKYNNLWNWEIYSQVKALIQ